MRRHLVTKNSFYARLADHGDEIVSDDDFAHLYAERKGRPSIPPSVMVRAMLCATHDKTSDAETSRRTRVDADWKAAMGVDDEFTGIGATTFSLMRSRMVVHDADAELFERTIEKAVKAGILKGNITAIIDSSPVHGAGAVADTYELVRGFLRQVVRAAGERLSEEAREAAEPFCGAKPDIDWQDPAARKAHLAELVAAGMALLVEAAGIDDPAVTEPADLLAQVIDQDVEADDSGEANPQIRQGVARDRVISHSDPDMRHGRKSASRRFDGHKLDVITDEDTELVLGVEVRAGNASDGEGAVPLLAQVMALPGIMITTLLGDMAYSDGDVREAVEELGAELVAKVPPVTNSGRFPKTDFAIDTEAGTVRRPAGQGPQGPGRHPLHLFPRHLRRLPPAGEVHDLGQGPLGGAQRPRGPHHPGEGRPVRARDQGAAAPAVQGGAQDRPPPGPGHGQGALPGPTKDAPAGAPRGHRGQLQAPGCARRVRHRSSRGRSGLIGARSPLQATISGFRRS